MEDNKVFVTLTHRTLHAVRVEAGRVVAGGECLLESKPAVEALLTAVEPSWKSEVARASASLWPDKTAWHLASDTEAMLDRTPEALRAIAVSSQGGSKGEMAYAACGAGDGVAVSSDGMDKWVLASAPADDLATISVALDELKVVSDGAGPAAFSALDAITSALGRSGKGSVVLWDLGSKRSTLILVTAKGIEGVAGFDVGLDSIFEAVQVALRLKFRGAGERLFFNETYDFSEPGPKIAAALAEKFKAALAKLPTPGEPTSLACLGLTGKQAWFIREVAAACGLSAWEPDLTELAAAMGLAFTESAPASNFSAFSAAILGHATPLSRRSASWRPDWVAVEATAEEAAQEVAPPPQERPQPAPVIEKPVKAAQPPVRMKPMMAVDPAPAPAPGVPKAVKPPSAPRPAGAPAPTLSFGAPVPAAPAPAPAPAPAATRPPISVPPLPLPPIPGAARPVVAPVAPPAPKAPLPEPPSASNSRSSFAPPEPDAPPPGLPGIPGMPGLPGLPEVPPAPKPAATVKFSVPGVPPPAAATTPPFDPSKAKATGATEAPFEPPQPKSRAGFYITVGVAAALVFAAIAIVLDARMEKAKAYDLEQQEALAHHVTEQRLKEAEESAKEKDELHRKELQEAVEIIRKQTEEETRRAVLAEVEADRLAKLPGTVLLATVPAGASVSIDGAAAATSPVRLETVQPGKHRARVTLDGHEPVEIPFEVKGSKTTDLGTVVLLSSFGQLDLASTPDGLTFAIRLSSDPAGKPLRTGTTPASLDDIPHGDYVVTFSRPGCRDHPERVSVEKGGKASVSTRYLDGSLELSSDPSGAWVDKDGTRLGTTPLVLHDLTPKTAEFELTLPGYDPTPVTCDIPEGQTLKLEAQLLRRDRVFKASEVKTMPQPTDSAQPQLSSAQRKLGGSVVLAVTVRRDGSVADIEVVKASDDDIARRCKVAVEGWKYRPATAPDDRTVDARIEIPFKFPAGGQ